MPILEIKKKDFTYPGKDKVFGVIAQLPDQDGEYRLSSGQLIRVEMNPAEESATGVLAIALTADLFLNRKRDWNKPDGKRRVVYINQETKTGSVDLNFYQILVVSLLGESGD